MRKPFRPQRTHRGFALLAILAILIAGVLYFVVNSLGPEALEAYRARKTEAALAEARDALMGYAVTHRDRRLVDGTTEGQSAMYGYLPLPDLGESINRNGDLAHSPCATEGCAKLNVNGIGLSDTYIGRFPWRTLGMAAVRDGYGECLWYVVSASHKALNNSGVMNWDTIGQLDIVIADGLDSLKSTIETPHDRPIAIIFSPGPAIADQKRDDLGTDDVTECGGNYNPANYLDPAITGALRDFDGTDATAEATYFSGNNSQDTSDTSGKRLAISASGQVLADGTLLRANACPAGTNCSLVANDLGLAITPDELFGALRKNANFRSEISDMLTKMTNCWSSNIASMTPVSVTFPDGSPSDKDAGKIPDAPLSCASNIATAYGDSHNPKGYFSNYREMIFVARPNSGTFTVNGDTTCKGVLVFSGQRGSGQTRVTDATDDTKKYPTNYLEPPVLDSFQGTGTTFSGDAEFNTLASGQTTQQDIVRCIPDPSKLVPSLVTSPALTAAEYDQLVSYDPASRSLTLGAKDVTTTNGAPATALFGCAWLPEVGTHGSGFRAYFTFQFMGITGGVGNNGFVFAAVDGESNGINVCGAAGTHLGYSGDNGVTPPLTLPKIGIEFDQGRNANAISSALNSGRNDPSRSYDCSGTPHYYSYNSHSAIMYWGNDDIAYDDNVHGYPTSVSATRPAPQNPDDLCATSPGIGFVDYRAHEDANGDGTMDSYLYHVRVEVTPTRNASSSAAEQSSTTFVTKAWIIRDSTTNAQIIAAMQNTSRSMAQLSPTTAATLTDTATAYDVAGAPCNSDGTCSVSGSTCGTDKVCYRAGMKSVRLGFTGSQRTQDQQVIISNFFTSWLQ